MTPQEIILKQRLELVVWCLDRGRTDEAREIIEQVLKSMEGSQA